MMASAHTSEAKHHRIAFVRPAEGAAFVAALSRFLTSPEGSAHRGSSDRAEVRVHPLAEGGLELYLSEGALAAVATVFSPVPVTDVCPFSALPADCTLIIDDSVSAWGFERRPESSNQAMQPTADQRKAKFPVFHERPS